MSLLHCLHYLYWYLSCLLNIYSVLTVPGPVRSLSFEDVRDTSMIVNWAKPAETNGILTGMCFLFKFVFSQVLVYVC